MKTFFNGFDIQQATFQASADLIPGRAVAYTETSEVNYPDAGEPFTGIVTACRDKVASVTLRGYAVGRYGNSMPSIGITKLKTGEDGVFEVDEVNGKPYTILAVHVSSKTFEFIL